MKQQTNVQRSKRTTPAKHEKVAATNQHDERSRELPPSFYQARLNRAIRESPFADASTSIVE